MANDITGRGSEGAGRDDRIGAADSAAYEAAAVRAECRGSTGGLTGCLLVAVVIILPALLYFGLFAAILVDELVLKTFWFIGNLPDPALKFLNVMYAPLIWLMEQFEG